MTISEEKQKIIDELIRNRETLSQSSIKTYVSILFNLYKKVFENTNIEIAKFQQQNKFLKVLEKVKPTQRKTYLSALSVLCPNCEKYRTQMNNDAIEANSIRKQQVKTQKETDNWVSQDDILNKFNELEENTNRLMRKKILTISEIQEIQNYILLVLLTGKYIPIRRSLDWAEMKIKDYNPNEDNYLILKGRKPCFYFNKYKTIKTYGEQEISINNELKSILNNWIKILKRFCPNNIYLLIDSECGKLTSSKITHRLNKIFNKKTSVNILRHSFITSKYENMPQLNNIIQEANEMGHSLTEHLQYIKRDEEQKT